MTIGANSSIMNPWRPRLTPAVATPTRPTAACKTPETTFNRRTRNKLLRIVRMRIISNSIGHMAAEEAASTNLKMPNYCSKISKLIWAQTSL